MSAALAVRGNPTLEELAAVVAVLTLVPTPTAPAVAHAPEWSAPTRLHRRTHLGTLPSRGWVNSSRPY